MTDSRLMLPVHEMAESFLPRIAGLDAGRELTASPALPRITVVAHPDELSGHAIAIHDLLDRVPDGRGLFYQPEWVRLMAPLFLQSGRRMHFLLAWRGERLIGMAPLVIEQRPWVRGHVRRVWFWGKVQGSLALEGDFLVPEATDVRPCARAFVAHLRGPSAPADYIELAYFRGASPCQVAFEAASHIAPEQIEPMVSHWAVLAPTFDAYCATLKKSVLGKVMNRLRAAERDLGAHLTCVSRLSADELEQVEALHVQRQRELAGKGRERHSLFEIPAERGIYHAMLETASQRGWARHYLLKSGEGRVLAFALCFHFAGTLFFHLTAFDSAHAKYEPGRVLMLLKIQAEIARGDTHHIDMMPGTTKIKEDFGNHVFSHRRYLAVNTGSLMSRLRCGVWQGQTAWLERLRALRSPRSAAEA